MIIPTAAALVFVQFSLPPNMVPPQRYDHPFKGKVIVHEISACRGCSGFTHGARHGVCEIYVKRSGYEDLVIRHEIAHCNGWNASHSN